jgi:hypothetical protein
MPPLLVNNRHGTRHNPALGIRPVFSHVSGQYVPILMVIARHERTRLQTFYLNSMHGNPYN